MTRPTRPTARNELLAERRVSSHYAPRPPKERQRPKSDACHFDRGAEGGPYRRRLTSPATHAALASAIASDDGSGTAS
jgi:hypothetical protein